MPGPTGVNMAVIIIEAGPAWAELRGAWAGWAMISCRSEA
jgi:hypothetical protein